MPAHRCRSSSPCSWRPPPPGGSSTWRSTTCRRASSGSPTRHARRPTSSRPVTTAIGRAAEDVDASRRVDMFADALEERVTGTDDVLASTAGHRTHLLHRRHPHAVPDVVRAHGWPGRRSTSSPIAATRRDVESIVTRSLRRSRRAILLHGGRGRGRRRGRGGGGHAARRPRACRPRARRRGDGDAAPRRPGARHAPADPPRPDARVRHRHRRHRRSSCSPARSATRSGCGGASRCAASTSDCSSRGWWPSSAIEVYGVGGVAYGLALAVFGLAVLDELGRRSRAAEGQPPADGDLGRAGHRGVRRRLGRGGTRRGRGRARRASHGRRARGDRLRGCRVSPATRRRDPSTTASAWPTSARSWPGCAPRWRCWPAASHSRRSPPRS